MSKIYNTQECIPVGCVPSAAVAVCYGGGCLPQCMLGYTPPRPRPGDPPGLGLGLETPPMPGPGDPLGLGLEMPLGLETLWAWAPPWSDPPTSPLGMGL